jgi:hypothetical protein
MFIPMWCINILYCILGVICVIGIIVILFFAWIGIQFLKIFAQGYRR